jgi:hypothetical protein
MGASDRSRCTRERPDVPLGAPLSAAGAGAQSPGDLRRSLSGRSLPRPLADRGGLWLAWFALASVINLIVLRLLLGREGIGLRDFYRGRTRGAHREIGSDLRWVGMALVIAAPLGILPNLLLSSVLWGDTTAGGALSFRPLPVFGAVAILAVFPIVHALAELPTYFGYVMPRLASANGWRIQAVVLCAAVLSVQHVFLPLLFDWRYLVWRALTSCRSHSGSAM